MIRIGVLVSGSGSNLQSIIDACGRGAIDGEVPIVLSNAKGAYALERARNRGIPTRVISPAEYPDRETFDRELAGALHEYRVDLVALAGFMRVLTPAFLRQFPGRIMNIHPALLPSFPGLHVRQKAIDHGVRFSGCTVHFVDGGRRHRAHHHPGRGAGASGRHRRGPAGPHTQARAQDLSPGIQLFAQGRLTVEGRKVIVTGLMKGGDACLTNPPLED